jgi:hypothetical protein
LRNDQHFMGRHFGGRRLTGDQGTPAGLAPDHPMK